MSRSRKNQDYSAKDREKNKRKKLARIEKQEAVEAMQNNPEPIDLPQENSCPIANKVVALGNRQAELTPLQKRNQARLEKILAERKKDKE